MAKFVKYNGGKESFYPCTNPKRLSRSMIYEVVHEEDLGCQTEYFLEGIEGHYNSIWFDELPVYLSITLDTPELLKEMKCLRMIADNSGISFEEVKTSYVRKVTKDDNNIYTVVTNNSCYIVKSDIVPIYLAISKSKPVLNKGLVCFRMETKNSKIGIQQVMTSPVCGIQQMVPNTYKVQTANSCYIVKVV